jgi:hypothetical protein
VRVRYLDPEPNGLATMLGGLIEGNLSAHAERQSLVTGGKPATFAVVARDLDVAVSIRFSPQGVAIRNGVVGRPHLVIRTDSETLVGLSAVPLKFGLPDAMTEEGREVNRKLLRRELEVKGLLLHAGKLARLNKLISVA